jgi:hypothetical protein
MTTTASPLSLALHASFSPETAGNAISTIARSGQSTARTARAFSIVEVDVTRYEPSAWSAIAMTRPISGQ